MRIKSRFSFVLSLLILISAVQILAFPLRSASAAIDVGVSPIVDPDTGARVYQLTDSATESNTTFYYHQNPFIDNDNFVYKKTTTVKFGATREGDINQYFKMNIRTNTTTALTDMGQFNGEFVQGQYMYGFRFSDYSSFSDTTGLQDGYLTRLDLTKAVTDPTRWTDYLHVTNSVSTPYVFIGVVSVNADGTKLLFTQGKTDGVSRYKMGNNRTVKVLDLTNNQITSIYEGPKQFEHNVFSPTNPNLLLLADQQAPHANRIENWYFLDLGELPHVTNSADIIQPINVQDYLSPDGNGHNDYYWAYTSNPSYNVAHAFWALDGKLNLDVIDHQLNLPFNTVYNLATLDVSDPSVSPVTTQIPIARQTKRLVPLTQWNLHFNKTTAQDWYVADSDAQLYYGIYSGSKYINMMHILPGGGIKSYPLAKLKNATTVDGNYNPNTHMFPGRDAILTTMKTGTTTDALGNTVGVYNLFLIEVPEHLQNAMNGVESFVLKSDFNIDGNSDGWAAGNDSFGAVSNGILTMTSTGGDPFITSADNLGIEAVANRYLKIRMKNNTSRTQAQIYFKTTTSADTWDDARVVTFNIQPNSDYIEYIVDMGQHPSWLGKIKQLRIDYLNVSAPNETAAIDYIRLSNLDTARSWNFNTAGSFEGWSMANQVAGNVAGGTLNLTATGADPYIVSEDSLSVDAASNKYITLRMKNNTSRTQAQIYFTTNSDPTFDETKSKAFPIIPNSNYTDYTIDMGAVPDWTGAIKRIRLDPSTTSNSNETFNIDYIRISN